MRDIKGDGKSQTLKVNHKMKNGMPHILGNMSFGGNPGMCIEGNAGKVSYHEDRPSIKGKSCSEKLVMKK